MERWYFFVGYRQIVLVPLAPRELCLENLWSNPVEQWRNRSSMQADGGALWKREDGPGKIRATSEHSGSRNHIVRYAYITEQ
jgi:hypothetical protein